MTIAPAEFEYLRKMLRDRAAIALEADKHYLAESRLAPLLVHEKLPSVQRLLEKLRAEPSGPLQRKILDAMTNNETWFFRDLAPFEALRTTILPALIPARDSQKRLTIWSAAASSGQEIYSIAMIVREHFPELLGWSLQLIATDISASILERARQACYSQLEVNRGLPARLLAKYFKRRGLEWELTPEVRRMVTFKELNLAIPWSEPVSADVIFLRNVLIYFEPDTKQSILRRMTNTLLPDGHITLGAVETTLNLDVTLERVVIGNAAFYRRRTPQAGMQSMLR
jgi:chemotaxis protein methyltransferase CheR